MRTQRHDVLLSVIFVIFMPVFEASDDHAVCRGDFGERTLFLGLILVIFMPVFEASDAERIDAS